MIAGTLILTTDGLKPVENLSAGDFVLTHRNRWRMVKRVEQVVDSTYLVKGHGHYGFQVAAGSSFLGRCYHWVSRGKYELLAQEWTEPELFEKGWFWSSPLSWSEPALDIPRVGGRGAEFRPEFWWMVGKWLADGVVTRKSGGALHIRISCSHEEVDETYERVNFNPPKTFHSGCGEYNWSRETRKRQVVLTTSHNGLGRWLTANFGKHAHKKHLPGWAFTMQPDWRQALLDGYLFGDGTYYTDRTEWKYASVSRSLALGIRLLAVSLGYSCAFRQRKRGGQHEIDGVQTMQRDLFVGSFQLSPSLNNTISTGSHRWFPIRSVQPAEAAPVYHLTVDEDESCVADGIVMGAWDG